jgi:Protein of unknown function (DUF3309)
MPVEMPDSDGAIVDRTQVGGRETVFSCVPAVVRRGKLVTAAAPGDSASRYNRRRHVYDTAYFSMGDNAMSVGTILLIILVIALLGGFSGFGGGPFYGTGYYGGGGLGLILVIVLVLVLLGRL